MADDNDLSFKLNLDSGDFVSGAQGALSTIQSLGNPENLSGLLSGFAEFGLALGAVGLAVYAVKEALDFTEEGEEIQQIQNQFDTLSSQAGISGDKLKEGLEQSAGGLISTNDLLKIANKSIIAMGDSASQLPQILELARKATLVTGGDVKTNFEDITRAIENGNQKLLKNLNIHVDVAKAEQTYAASIGKTVGTLSEYGKQQAVLNAVLTEGGEAYKNVTLDQNRTVDGITAFKVAIQELGELIAVVVSKTIGPAFSNFFSNVGGLAKEAKGWFQATWGIESKGTQINRLNDNLLQLKGKLVDLEILNKQSFLDKMFGPSKEEQIKKIRLEITATEAELNNLNKVQTAAHEKETAEINKEAAARKKAHNDKSTDQNKETAETLKFDAEMAKLSDARLKLEEKNITSEARVDELINKEKEKSKTAHFDALKKIAEAYKGDTEKIDKLQKAENDRYDAEIAQQDTQLYNTKLALLKQYQSDSKTIGQGIVSQAKVDATQMTHDLTDMGKQGQNIMKTLDNAGSAAFTALGNAAAQGSQNAAKAMAGALLGAVGQFAVSQGNVVIADGIAKSIMLNPQGPLEIAAGGTLVALGTAIQSLAGTSSSTPSVSSGGSPSASAAPAAAASTQTQQSSLQQQQLNQRTVQVNIQGNYLNTPQAQRSLMEMMRAESDATSFQYNQIGVK